jgi:hypothetical protein
MALLSGDVEEVQCDSDRVEHRKQRKLAARAYSIGLDCQNFRVRCLAAEYVPSPIAKVNNLWINVCGNILPSRIRLLQVAFWDEFLRVGEIRFVMQHPPKFGLGIAMKEDTQDSPYIEGHHRSLLDQVAFIHIVLQSNMRKTSGERRSEAKTFGNDSFSVGQVRTIV